MRTALLAAFTALVVALIALAIVEPVVLLQGWLAGFVWAGMIPIGSLILLLVNRLTGGEWGGLLGPILEPAARAIAGVALISIPVLIFSAAIYRWPMFAGTPKSLTAVYMTPPFFAFRTVIGFCIWTLLAWLPVLRSTQSGAGISLIALAIVTNVIPVDWIISAQPGFYSSDFGFGFGIEQVLTALAFCAVFRVTAADSGHSRDLAGMLIAAILGTTYMYYMEFTVIWYGNLPGKVDWFNNRGNAPWAELAGAAFAIGALIPFLFLLNDRIRGSAAALRLIGFAILFGESLHVLWLVVPGFGLPALLPACFAVIAAAIAGTFWIFATTGFWPAGSAERDRTAQQNG
jgi:hypothetical protein